MIAANNLVSNHDRTYVQASALKSRHDESADIVMIRGEGTYSWIYLTSGK